MKRTHGETGLHATPEYRAWKSIKWRCYNPKNRQYRHYGGRGIIVCDRWLHDYVSFLADVGRRPSPNHSLDRFPNNDGNYEPGNVRWATSYEQVANRRLKRIENFSDEDIQNEIFRRTPEYGLSLC